MKKLTLFVLSSLLVSGSVLAQNVPWTAAQNEKARLCNVALSAEFRGMEKLFNLNSEKVSMDHRSKYFPARQDLMKKQSALNYGKDEFSKTLSLCEEYTVSAKKLSAELNAVIDVQNQAADKRFVSVCIAEWKKLDADYVKLKLEAVDKKAIPVGPKFDDLDKRSGAITTVMLKNGNGYIDNAKECKKAWNDQMTLNADMKKSIADGLAAQSVKKDVKVLSADELRLQKCKADVDGFNHEAQELYNDAKSKGKVTLGDTANFENRKKVQKEAMDKYIATGKIDANQCINVVDAAKFAREEARKLVNKK